MYEITVSDLNLYSDYILVEPRTDKIILINLLERSRSTVQAAVANIYRGVGVTTRGRFRRAHSNGQYSGYVESFQVGKTKYHQGLVKSDKMYSKTSMMQDEKIEVVLVQNENQNIADILFDALYDMHDLPLKSEWKQYIHNSLQGNYLTKCVVYKEDDFSYVIKEGSIVTDLANWEFFNLCISASELDEIISNGIRSCQIEVTDFPQRKIEVETLDDYFQMYGPKVIENVMKGIKPIYPRNPKIDFKFTNKTPFPVQGEVMNGLENYLQKNRSAILVGEMGVGKTLMSVGSICLAMENSRNVVMAPSIMLEKWKQEIEDEIQNANVTIVTTFSQVIALRKLKDVKPKGREFYIFSKDFLKLSYEQIPVVNREIKKTMPIKECTVCDAHHYDSHTLKKCTCGSTEFRKRRTRFNVEGVRCYSCGEICFPNITKIDRLSHKGEDDTNPLTLMSFEQPSNKNAVCGHCSTTLWQPNVNNFTLDNEYSAFQNREQKWMKIKVPRNKSNKTYITKYIMKDRYESSKFCGELSETPHSIVKFQKSRKYSPSRYMKKYLGKDFFDFGIFDEAHQFKSGGSAQGNAFAQLLKTTKKSIVMTGTISVIV